MKNLFKNIAVLTSVVVVAASFASCHNSSEEEAPLVPVTKESKVVTSNTLVVQLTNNIAGVTVLYNGKEATVVQGTIYTWSNAAASGTITVGGGSIVPVSPVAVSFGKRNTLVYEIDVQKVSEGKTQEEVESGAEVTNDDDNQESTGAKASLKLPTGVGAHYSGAVGEYSLTLFVPTQKPIAPEDIKVNEPISVTPFAVNCEPSGTTFDDPGVYTEIEIEGIDEIGADGISYQHTDGTPANRKAVNGNKLSGYLPHFSIWNVIVNATCTSMTEEKIELASGTLVAGQNTVPYKENCGVEFGVKGILATFIKLIFGASHITVDKTTTIDAKGEGTYIIYQKVYNQTYKAGNKVFTVKTYGEVTTNTTTYEPAPTHNGGSN